MRKILPLALTLLSFVLFPKIKLTFIAPLLTLSALTLDTPRVYRYAILGGFLLDLLNSEYLFGFFTASCLFATWVVHSQRHNFFADKLWGLALYTSLFSFAKIIFEIIALGFFSSLPPFTWKGIFSECIIMSVVDGFYALLIFTGPMYLATIIEKRYIRWKHPKF